jgi:hypothetical protein
MVPGVFAGNISAEATTPTGNTFDEATRGVRCRRECRRAVDVEENAAPHVLGKAISAWLLPLIGSTVTPDLDQTCRLFICLILDCLELGEGDAAGLVT